MHIPSLPVGFRPFHRNAFLNYQFNRVHALGWVPGDELSRHAARVRRPRDCVEVFSQLAETAGLEGRLLPAVGYARLAEFFTRQRSPEKRDAYMRFRNAIDAAFPLQRIEIPYRNASLFAYEMKPAGQCRGDILFFGGFDSLIEEFLGIWERIMEAGYRVIAFDGPGQGGSITLSNLRMEHDWEAPVTAVLDHFDIDDVTLIGFSMGGYWATRAAAYENRVVRLVAWPPVYDWMFQLPTFFRSWVPAALKFRTAMNLLFRLRMRLFPILDHAIRQALYLSGGKDPVDGIHFLLGMNHKHIGAERVKADVLMLNGETDMFQPPKLAEYQKTALTNARNITTKMFRTSEQAGHHCQMGNLDLAVDAVIGWLREHDQEYED